MTQSMTWSQCDSASLKTANSGSDVQSDDPRDAITKKLQALDQDYVIVNQLYKVHKQRAAETNRSAFRKAYRCNAQKVSIALIAFYYNITWECVNRSICL